MAWGTVVWSWWHVISCAGLVIQGGLCGRGSTSYDNASQFEKELERRVAEGLCWSA
jgi:hypothetical protein